ncbi:PP2C family protein-serine/threonine phosphatase [Kaarinaea lacus]
MPFHHYGQQSHVGKIRVHNEDSHLVDADNGFCVLADGMGGHEGGEVASKIVVETVAAELRAGKPLADAMIVAHQAVVDAVKEGKGREGMGSTAVALQINGDRFEIVWVGDSRGYLWDGEQLIQLSKDHSLVQDMVDEGRITAEEAKVHPHRNYVTQALGMIQLHNIKVGRVEGKLQPDFIFLLCSDGLSEDVPHSQINEVMSLAHNEQVKTDLLIQQALENGGSDNITVILVSARDSG